MKEDDNKVTEYVNGIIQNYKDSDYKHLVFIYDELIDSKSLENAEKVYEILRKVRYQDPESYIFNYLLEKAKGNSKKTRKIISYAQDSFQGIYFERVSMQEYLDQKEFNNANILFNSLLVKYPEGVQKYQTYLTYIMALIKNEYIDKAIEVYELALKEFPENIQLRNNYAYLLAEHNRDLDKAITLAMNAVEKQPNNISFLDTLAWIYFIKGDHKKAEEYIEKAFDQSGVLLDPNSKELYEHYAKIKTKLNKLKDIDKIKINELAIDIHECVNSAMSLLK